MITSPQDIRFICSRITIELAEAIKDADNNMLHIDDALIVAATPAVLINYGASSESDLKRIMIPLKRFFGRNPRYRNFTKAAVAEGLRQEWLPSLNDGDKVRLLSDWPIIQTVDDNGYIIYNPTLVEAITKTARPDNWKYGKEPYSSAPTCRKQMPRAKVLLTAAAPDTKLLEKMSPYIDWYKLNWNYLHEQEDYKWKGIRHFQSTFNIEAEDFADNLREAFSKAGNLLSAAKYYPLATLVKNARLSPEAVRQAFVRLYDEQRPLYERSSTFIDEIAAIHKSHQEAKLIKATDSHQQSDRAVSVYLAFMYPDRHYLFKTSVWNDFKSELNLDYPPLSHFAGKLAGYELIANHICAMLTADAELMALLSKSEPEDCYAGHLLTQDFMYCVAWHLPDLTYKQHNHKE